MTSASYQIISPARDVTLLDQLVTNSPLTVDGSIVRGFHLREGNFFFHGGYTSTAAFENLIFPTQKEGVAGIGYRFAAGSHAFVMPNVYYFSGSRSSENYLGAGGVASGSTTTSGERTSSYWRRLASAAAWQRRRGFIPTRRTIR